MMETQPCSRIMRRSKSPSEDSLLNQVFRTGCITNKSCLEGMSIKVLYTIYSLHRMGHAWRNNTMALMLALSLLHVCVFCSSVDSSIDVTW